jgi:hypothetical protein
MKKLLLILTLLLTSVLASFGQDFKMPTEADYPKLEKIGQKVEDFVPRNWNVMARECGDLNGDKAQDCVLIVKGKDAKFLNKNEGLGADVFDTNPRMLLILFKNPSANRFELIEQSNSFIFVPDSPTMSEPFQSVKIKNGVVQLDFELWYSAGSWGTTQASYKFKYMNNEFALIGADKTESMRNTGETETRSYNFLTGKMNVTTGNFSSDKKGKTKWRTLKAGKLKTFRTFVKPFDWEIEKDYFI